MIASKEMRWTLMAVVRYVREKLMGFAHTTVASEVDEHRHRILIGYTCVCGERVVVYRLRRRRANVLPISKTVTCPNAHVATFSAQQFALLDDWSEDGCL